MPQQGDIRGEIFVANHLGKETSPYLLQHVGNPVDWHPWGEEALGLAKKQDKPVLLSIGYAACHWCHVMAHESFEDDETALLMNENFINIKVDREERPDLDSIYMSAVTAMTGHGGWPMTVFLTPEGRPFYSGTYFPKEPRYGMPSFRQILLGVADAWKNKQDEVQEGAEQIIQHIQQTAETNAQVDVLDTGILTSAVSDLKQRFDRTWGGFGQAPKFPQPMVIEFLLREHLRGGDEEALAMAEFTLQRMARGGMYDQIGGGFARYSVDEQWLVPHFEKMLYDNAQLARVYLHAWQHTGNPLYRRIVEETLDYVCLEMRHGDGGFFSSQDADSEGVEGKFYVWSADEVRDILADDASLFMRMYDVTDSGNWEGHNILRLSSRASDVAAKSGLDEAGFESRIAPARQKLYEVRSKRVWPGLDDKVLTAWNGLMLAAFAEAAQALDRQDYRDVATANAEFLHATMRAQDGRLLRTWKAGSEAKYNAYLEDYAFLAEGLLTLYQTTFDKRWFQWARQLADDMLAHFSDAENGGFYDTRDDHEQLIHRPKDVQDNAIPSRNAMAAHVLLKLGLLTGEPAYWDTAERATKSVGMLMAQYPSGFGEWLNAVSLIMGESREIALVGSQEQIAPLLSAVRTGYRPLQVVAAGAESDDDTIPLLANRRRVNDSGTAYVCRRFVCETPVTDPQKLMARL
jgi:uncharacterized protein YyaL (SSP411 family)